MIHDKKVLAVIPARGGSKGLPGKNIRPLCGKPLLAWTIEQALDCPYIDTVVVSTDSPEIAAVSEQYGVPVPFLRPAELATDSAASADVLLHVLSLFEKQNQTSDYIILLEATSPLRRKNDIATALKLLDDHPTAESIVGVCRTESQHPAFSVTLQNGFIKPYSGDFCNGTIPVLRRQEIDDVYFFEGSLYISRVAAFKRKKGFYHTATIPYIVQKWQSIEVDDIYDFDIVEALIKYIEE